MIAIIIANVALWPIIHIVVSWYFTKLPRNLFDPNHVLFRQKKWEQNGLFYDKCFNLKKWKKRLPDGAAWFNGGFPKGKLLSKDPAYLNDFIKETCRGEAAHLATMLVTPLFFIWNPPWADLVMLGYGILANLPCIMVQRYNRIFLTKLSQRRL